MHCVIGPTLDVCYWTRSDGYLLFYGIAPGTHVRRGGLFLFDIENDPLEEKDLSASQPGVVQELVAALVAYNITGISQDVENHGNARDTEPCGNNLSCTVPWLPSVPGERCTVAPTPAPSPSPLPPPRPIEQRSHLTEPANWVVTEHTIGLDGWVCYSTGLPKVELQIDDAASAAATVYTLPPSSKHTCGDASMSRFNLTIHNTSVDFTEGTHRVRGAVARASGGSTVATLGNSPQCIRNGRPVACP